MSGLTNGGLVRLMSLDGKGAQTLKATDEKSNVVKVSIKERGKSYGGMEMPVDKSGEAERVTGSEDTSVVGGGVLSPQSSLR